MYQFVDFQKASLWRRIAGFLVCALVLVLVSAASFNGFYDKWGFREGRPRFSADKMLDGTANRPFVYRQMNPLIVHVITNATPEKLKVFIQAKALHGGDRSNLGPDRIIKDTPDAFWRYTVLYLLTFIEWLIAVGFLATLCARFTGLAASIGAASVFALLFPVLQSQGGYFYDFPEMMFMAAAAYCAARGWLIPLAAVALAGVTNKETMVFFLPTLLPFLAARIGGFKAVGVLGGLSILAAGLYVVLRSRFAGNPGGAVEVYLLDNIKFYGNPLHLLAIEETYGLPLFRAYSLVGVALLLVVGVAGWRAAPKTVRGHVLLALLVNVPLFAMMAYPAEIRNFSLTFVGWTLLAACAIRAWMADPRNGQPRLPAEAR